MIRRIPRKNGGQLLQKETLPKGLSLIFADVRTSNSDTEQHKRKYSALR